MLTHGAMQRCGLTSWVVCINDKNRDTRERNVTIRSEIWTTNIHSLGFWDIKKWVTLWRLILQSLGYNLQIPLKQSVSCPKSSASTGCVSNSTGSSATNLAVGSPCSLIYIARVGSPAWPPAKNKNKNWGSPFFLVPPQSFTYFLSCVTWASLNVHTYTNSTTLSTDSFY